MWRGGRACGDLVTPNPWNLCDLGIWGRVLLGRWAGQKSRAEDGKGGARWKPGGRVSGGALEEWGSNYRLGGGIARG